MRSTISTLLSRVWPGLAPRKQAGGIPVSFHHLRYEVIDERAWVGWTAVVEKEWETRLCLLRKEWVLSRDEWFWSRVLVGNHIL